MGELLAVDFHGFWSNDLLEKHVARVPVYTHFNNAARHVIRAIHALPSLERGLTLGNINVYLGRTAATGRHAAGRFETHADKHGRDHDFGAIIFRARTSDVVMWEGWLNRALLVLERRGRLCIANLAADGRGRVPETEDSVVDMTWEIIKREPVAVPNRSDIDAIARTLEEAGELDASSARRAFDPITRPKHARAEMAWAAQQD